MFAWIGVGVENVLITPVLDNWVDESCMLELEGPELAVLEALIIIDVLDVGIFEEKGVDEIIVVVFDGAVAPEVVVLVTPLGLRIGLMVVGARIDDVGPATPNVGFDVVLTIWIFFHWPGHVAVKLV